MTTIVAAGKDVPSPQPNAETQAFWDAATRGEFILRRCLACSRAHWYPRAICPHCFSTRTQWEPASGNATIYSFSVTRRVATPYAIAYVTLAEGPTMLTNIVDCNPDTLRIGQDVRISFVHTNDGVAVPMFVPA